MKNRFAWSLLIVSLYVAGCGEKGPDLSAVTGVVTYDGKPVDGATVTFYPENGQIATGTTDTEGKFKLTSTAGEGAVVGPGTFSVAKSEKAATPAPTGTDPTEMMKKMAEKGNIPVPKSLIPAKYNNPETSGLKHTVDADATKNNFTLDLKD